MENENPNVNTNPAGEGTNANANQNHAPQQQANQGQQAQQQDSGLRTFTQEQLDAIIARERSKATKGWFTADQMAAKDTSISSLTTERDNARADLAKVQEQLDALQHEKFLAGKGVPSEMLEFYAFKIGKLVTDKKTFEQAAEEYIKDNPPAGTVRMSTGGGVNNGGGTQPQTSNEKMNAIFRSAK